VFDVAVGCCQQHAVIAGVCVCVCVRVRVRVFVRVRVCVRV